MFNFHWIPCGVRLSQTVFLLWMSDTCRNLPDGTRTFVSTICLGVINDESSQTVFRLLMSTKWYPNFVSTGPCTSPSS